MPPGAQLEDVSKRRYGKLVLMTDADIDGSHIRTLLLTFIFRHLRELVEQGCIYIAQPPLYKVVHKKSVRYVQTHEEMDRELLSLGSADSALEFTPPAKDGAPAQSNPGQPKTSQNGEFDGERLQSLIGLIGQLEEPFETLERRGIELEWLVAHHATPEGLLPRYRVYVGRDEHWFVDKDSLDKFLADEEAKRGEQFEVADDETVAAGLPLVQRNGHSDRAEAGESRLQVVDLHEVRVINQVLASLRAFGVVLNDFVPAGNRNGEPIYPQRIHKDETTLPLSSLRDLLPKLREIGKRGRSVTRFKGLGEMDAEELWKTSMDPANRVLLQVTMDDANAADEIFRVLMGDHVEPRRDFIEKHALDVRNLDI